MRYCSALYAAHGYGNVTGGTGMKIIIAAAAALMCAGCASVKSNGSAGIARSGIKSVTTIAESFGDGEKVSSVAIEFPKTIDAVSLSADDFTVAGREVSKVVTNDRAAIPSGASVRGKYVIVKLRYVNKWDATDGKMPARPERVQGEDEGNGPRFEDDGTPVDLSAVVTQTGEVRARDGTVYAADNVPRKNDASIELVIQDFKKNMFTDAETGITLPYFVYLPDGYSEREKYPLVYFIPDASADTSIDTATLTQGNGATIWATPEEQAKHKSIVVAVQYPLSVVKQYGALTTDDYVWTQGLTAVHNLLQHIIDTYAVDRNRIYGTGQSQGCMTNIALSDRYPDLFAAQYLVAGQWNVEEMAAMKDKKLWIVVCTGDTKAYPGFNAATALWEKLGSRVARNETPWNSKAASSEIEADIDAIKAQNADINYTVFADGSHMYTWSFAYYLEGVRDWLFAQTK